MRRMFVLLLVGLMVLPAAMAAADPPSESGVVDRAIEPGGFVFDDPDEGVLVLVNFASVEDFCEDEPAGAGLVQVVEQPDGVLGVKVSDDDVPVLVVPEDGFFELACDDPAGYPVIASGTAGFQLHDSDALGSRTRAAAFGAQLHGTVADDDGNLYNLIASVRLRITPDDDFKLVRSDVSLVPR